MKFLVIIFSLSFLGTVFSQSHPLHPASDLAALEFDASKILVSSANQKTHPQVEGVWKIKSDTTKQIKVSLRSEVNLDFRSKIWMCLDIFNRSAKTVMVRGSASHNWNECLGGVVIAPGKLETLYIHLPRKAQRSEKFDFLYGKINGLPNGTYSSSWKQLDLAKVRKLDLMIFGETNELDLEISHWRAMGGFTPLDKYKFSAVKRPYIDVFGQNKLEEWSTKITSASDLKEGVAREREELKRYPGGKGLSEYGGDLRSPKQEARGHFYTKKIEGKWWFVDPQGYLFWSFGLTSIGYGGDTAEPAINKLRSQVSGSQKISLGKRPGIWNPSQSNLLQKYGENWKTIYPDLTHRRLKSWGMNTLGNWTKKEFYSLRKTPYTLAVHFGRPEVKLGQQAKSLPDAFHPDFEKSLRQTLGRLSTQANDPWCIGFFIDNELDFGDQSFKTAQIILEGDVRSYTRQKAIHFLKSKYVNLENLNKAWNRNFKAWADISRGLPAAKKACREDLLKLSRIYLEKYFSTCAKLMKEYAPKKLYLGSRIHFKENAIALEESSRFCDVVSINCYDFSPLTVKWPKAVTKPVIIGEYHFGTINESGVWGGGLCTSVDLKHAAAQFKAYTAQAYKDPRFVGAHYFQLKDQVVTGRKDGENYRIGFLDITDQPYEAMIKCAREVAAKMYKERLK
jgi:hypothetical protein